MPNLFSRGQIYALLRNPLYIGKIRHKTKVWDGQHEPIVSEAVWDRVQKTLEAGSTRPRGRKTAARQLDAKPITPLTGKLRAETGDRLTPTHTRRHGRQIRYYVSNRLVTGGTDPRGWRLSAPAFEKAVANAIAGRIRKLAHDHRTCTRPDLQRDGAIQAKARRLANRLSEGAPNLLQKILDDGQITKNGIVLRLNTDGLTEALEMQPNEMDRAVRTIEAPFELRRHGVEGRIVIGDRDPQPDRTLPCALSRAHV